MKSLPLLCILACSWAEGDISPEPNVVLQAVQFGNRKKPDVEIDGSVDCPGYGSYSNVFLRSLLNNLYPHSARYKRDDSSFPGVEALGDKTMERLLSALEELKQDVEKNPEETKEGEEDARKARLEQICRKGGKWQRKLDECLSKRRKGDIDSCKKMLKDNLEDLIAENKYLEKWLKKMAYRKKDLKELLERSRLKESLADSWPRVSEDRLPEDLYFPMPYHHQPSHQRAYPTAEDLP